MKRDFDEVCRNGYSTAMRARVTCRLALTGLVFFLFFSSCTFNYGSDQGGDSPVPGLVMDGARAQRYENAELSVVIEAKSLEMYDTDRVWSGEGVVFSQYAADGTGSLEAEGAAGLLLVDDGKKSYSLGKGTRFRYYPDGITLESPDLRWDKNTSRLQGTVDGSVTIRKDDGSSILGTGFFADTLARTYRFDRAVSGSMVRETTEVSETTESTPGDAQ